jgi:hypothetical protein
MIRLKTWNTKNPIDLSFHGRFCLSVNCECLSVYINTLHFYAVKFDLPFMYI